MYLSQYCSDLWEARIIQLAYFSINYRCTGSYIRSGQNLTFANQFLTCELPETAIGCTFLLPMAETVIPECLNCVFYIATEYGVTFSPTQEAILNSSDPKMVYGDDSNGAAVITRNGSFAEVITL